MMVVTRFIPGMFMPGTDRPLFTRILPLAKSTAGQSGISA